MAFVTFEVRGQVAFIGLNRPAKLHAFHGEMLRDLARAYAELDAAADVRVGVLFAHPVPDGKKATFTAGLDLPELTAHFAAGGRLFGGGEGSAENELAENDVLGLHGKGRERPLVCAIEGRCFTIGIELALEADIVVASSDATFSQIEVTRGILPFGGATIRGPLQLGWGNAMRFLLTGEAFDAQTAQRIGLVQDLTSPGGALAEATRIAETIAKQAPLAVQATLRSARRAAREGERVAAKELYGELAPLLGSDDAREGVVAMMERRAPVFRGK